MSKETKTYEDGLIEGFQLGWQECECAMYIYFFKYEIEDLRDEESRIKEQIQRIKEDIKQYERGQKQVRKVVLKKLPNIILQDDEEDDPMPYLPSFADEVIYDEDGNETVKEYDYNLIR